MKKLLPLLLPCLLCVNICFSQQPIEYANFIKSDTAVKWAAVYNSYVNLTPANPKLSIRNFYVNKLKKQGATAYIEDSASFTVTPTHINYNDYISSIKPISYGDTKTDWWFRADEKMTALEIAFNKESNKCDTCLLINKVSLFNVKQLLYYKDHQFKIQNVLMRPVIYKKGANDFKEDASYYEATDLLFNEAKTDDVSIPPSAKFISRSFNNLTLKAYRETNDNVFHETNCKFLGNGDSMLVNWLYKDIKDKKLQAYSTDRSIYPDPHNMLDLQKVTEYKNDPVLVPIMDSTGAVVQTMTVRADMENMLSRIYNFTLIQDLYFDFTKEKLYSKVIALVPRLPVYTSSGKLVGFTDYWGVMFPQEKKKAVKKSK